MPILRLISAAVALGALLGVVALTRAARRELSEAEAAARLRHLQLQVGLITRRTDSSDDSTAGEQVLAARRRAAY
jgi:hypothetical protein